MEEKDLKHRVRPRVGALLVEEESLLLLQMQLPTRTSTVWMPPGGEIQYSETMEEALRREVREETGLTIEIHNLAYINEFIQPPFHAVEHYFVCRRIKGSLKVGNDPEFATASQMIMDSAFIPFDRLSDTRVAPAFIQDRLVDDWKSRKLQQSITWIADSY